MNSVSKPSSMYSNDRLLDGSRLLFATSKATDDIECFNVIDFWNSVDDVSGLESLSSGTTF